MLMNITALYDADKLAHDEAIRNGGVCPSNAYTYFLNKLIFSLYFTGMAFQIQRPA